MNTYPDLICAVQPFEPDTDALYSIDSTAHLTGVSRHDILMYCKHGFVTPLADPEFGALYFDDDALRSLRRIGYLRDECGVNLTGIRIILDLIQKVERLRNGEDA